MIFLLIKENHYKKKCAKQNLRMQIINAKKVYINFKQPLTLRYLRKTNKKNMALIEI